MNTVIGQALSAALYIAAVLLADVCCAHAQFPDITLPDGRGLTPMASGPGTPVDDLATNVNTDITATSVTTGGMSGGFDPNLALSPDLQQQVSSTNGLPLDNGEISRRYTMLWPGYGNANYGQSYADGSPEGSMLTTLGTLQVTLQAGADQQNSQIAEANRLEALETENLDATGIFQLLQIDNEAAYFVAEQEMKLRKEFLRLAHGEDGHEHCAAFGEGLFERNGEPFHHGLAREILRARLRTARGLDDQRVDVLAREFRRAQDRLVQKLTDGIEALLDLRAVHRRPQQTLP